ncbi:VTT domain-containing protein [Baekduia sp.]|uniref:TVP38/TMEM64 family protein n=1 Tax=Baekduia sp. TaxID=2600305 RepID=UPI002E04809C|nr:VTT domain-containing protein [Baekduia sp.]
MTGRRSLQVLAVIVAVAVLVATSLLIHPVREAAGHAASGDTTALRHQLRGTGVTGVLLLYALMLGHIVLLFPAEVINLVAGFTYGIPIAMAICVSGWFASAMGTYALGRIAGRPLVEKLAGARRLAAAEELMERGGWPALLVLRLLPVVPFSGVGYVAGATRVPVGRFAWTSAIGAIPLIAIAVVLGSRLEHFSATDPLVWAMVAGFAALFALSHPLTRRWQRSRAARERV